MASITALSRLFNNITINIPRKIDLNLISTSSSLGYLKKSNTKKYVQKYYYDSNKKSRLRVDVPWLPKKIETYKEMINITPEDEKKITEVQNEINQQITTQNTGRLFAVIHVCGKQYKITESDIIVIHGYWPPTAGDQINFEKVLLVGSTDFTLIGRPILNTNLVSVNATVVDKTLSHTKTHFLMRKRKQFRRIHFVRSQLTTVRINSIELMSKVNEVQNDVAVDAVY